MNEEMVREVLRSDVRVKDLINNRAYQLYLSHVDREGSAEQDWCQAEQEIVAELTDKLMEAEHECWQVMNQHQPELQDGNSFTTLVGFMLAKGGTPTRGDLFDTRYYTIGLSYITGMFQIGRTLDETLFLRHFANDNAIVQALAYRIRTDPASPYFSNGDSAMALNSNEEELKKYLTYAEVEACNLFDQLKQMLLPSTME